MIGHVTYGDTESVIVQGNKVEKISPNCGHRYDAGAEVKPRALRKFPGENALLDFPCYFQLFLELFLLNNLGLSCFQVVISSRIVRCSDSSRRRLIVRIIS